jgi:hypothetical protein
MNRDFKVADGMAAGEIADGIAGEKEEHAGFDGSFTKQAQSVTLVGRKPVFQKVDVVGHSMSLLPRRRFPSV